MAKKRKHTTRRRHYRRVGAVHTGFMQDVEEAAGLVVGSVLATVAQRQFTSVNPKLVSGGEVIAGFMIKKHSTTGLMRGIGWGVLGAGAIGLTHEIGLIHGIDDLVSGMYDSDMGLIEEKEYMGGITNQSYVAGISNNDYVGAFQGRSDQDYSSYAV